ncbi:hypothetical protein KC19_1G220600 [Ceratodon purpureus]|uniref:J domain-containing protein n=1 Tax=Ceratodon purpureus TaxID=3225 RepID=A0A8T0JAS6_CERPU|nr:hypothetical protein KC19_1G220600 [Ceratodon purpureus]
MGFLNYKNAFLVVALALMLNYLILCLHSPSSSKDLYQVLGVSETANATEINVAFTLLYQSLSTSMKTEPMFDTKERLVDLRHAHNILSDERRRREYDIFQVDVLQEAVQGAKEVMIKTGNLEYEPLSSVSWDVQPEMVSYPSQYSQFLSETQSLTSQNFDKLVLESEDVWVILLYSETSIDSNDLTKGWSVVAELLSGVAKVGRVEIGELPLSVSLAQKTLYTKQPRFMSGLPEVVVVTSECLRFDCVTRYRGLKTVHAVTEWIATSVLKLPQIFYPRSKSLINDVIHGGEPHKVKVLVFSYDGRSRAPLYIRQAAKKYHEHALFAMVVWEEHKAAFREFLRDPDLEMPELVILKDPGLKPVVYQGPLNSLKLERLMEEHKTFVLPQLRSISSEALGCDARGNSLAGNDTRVWYCVIVAGRTGRLLSEMRGVMREVLQNLTQTELVADSTEMPRQNLLAVEALRSRRLSLSWLDGEKQKDFCYFYLHSPTMFEACGPRRYGEVDDLPKIFLIRYHRKPLTIEDLDRLEKEKALRAKNVWTSLLSEDNENVASQLVSKYNGSTDTGEIVQWISQMVYDGDHHELPGFGGGMPELVPEEKVTFWTETKNIVLDGQARAVQNSQWFTQAFSWASKIDMDLFPVFFFLVIFFASHCFLHRKKLRVVGQDLLATGGEQSSSGISEGNAG